MQNTDGFLHNHTNMDREQLKSKLKVIKGGVDGGGEAPPEDYCGQDELDLEILRSINAADETIRMYGIDFDKLISGEVDPENEERINYLIADTLGIEIDASRPNPIKGKIIELFGQSDIPPAS